MSVEFTCAVCPNGCRLSVELSGDDHVAPIETGRCVRGQFLIGKEYFFDGTSLVKLDAPMTKSAVAELVEKKKASRRNLL